MSFPELLRQCRKQKHMSQAELASLLGVTQQAVGKWESGKSSPDPTTVAKLAEILDTTADYLLGLFDPTAEGQTEERFFGSYVYSLIPVIGTVKAGYGALAYEEDYGKEYARVKDPSSYFYLVVRGDSMEPRIHDGDLALVHRQDTLENGDLGVLIYGDEGEGTLKRYLQRGNCVVLQPFNPAYNELVIKGEDLNRLHIAGRVVETKATLGGVELPLSPTDTEGVFTVGKTDLSALTSGESYPLIVTAKDKADRVTTKTYQVRYAATALSLSPTPANPVQFVQRVSVKVDNTGYNCPINYTQEQAAEMAATYNKIACYAEWDLPPGMEATVSVLGNVVLEGFVDDTVGRIGLFPASAGMNRPYAYSLSPPFSVPRVRGDEP